MRRPEWKRSGARAAGFDIGVEFALEKLAHKHRTAFDAIPDHVADQNLAEAGGDFGSKIADLVGMGKEDDGGSILRINCSSAAV